MRPIHLARLDKTRPVLVLTRQLARDRLTKLTVAPITSTVRGLTTELTLGPENGLDHACVASLDNVLTMAASDLGRHLGYLLPDQEPMLTAAIMRAFDLAPAHRDWS